MSSQQTAPDTESKTEEEPEPQQRRLDAKRAQAPGAESTSRDGESIDETVHLTVFRYDPDIEAKQDPRFDDFRVPYNRGMTVLYALIE